ncbi:hypothetical protein GYMLUDRAFT_250855 [Collybiopsis luxurians FD-317 M1]|uniref:Unplaced genomic scaffold GYMLUscaffold_88, whole genome shotgun sequence n=1 Tax=Collybiopsis luxurians FD-317 M1 TaxID=944289 RepID=A0A0D0AR75_9AGAR|nr:hypothetical protein GYMLUDRAFT_250855 [Collybiopsis luxurians FD-317 M1]
MSITNPQRRQSDIIHQISDLQSISICLSGNENGVQYNMLELLINSLTLPLVKTLSLITDGSAACAKKFPGPNPHRQLTKILVMTSQICHFSSSFSSFSSLTTHTKDFKFHGPLVPKLKVLELGIWDADSLPQTGLVRLISSRWIPNTARRVEIGVDCLQSFKLKIASGWLTDSAREELEYLRLAGLSVHVSKETNDDGYWDWHSDSDDESNCLSFAFFGHSTFELEVFAIVGLQSFVSTAILHSHEMSSQNQAKTATYLEAKSHVTEPLTLRFTNEADGFDKDNWIGFRGWILEVRRVSACVSALFDCGGYTRRTEDWDSTGELRNGSIIRVQC